MVKDLEDGEFWLPAEFLCDDFFLEEGKSGEVDTGLAGSRFATEFSDLWGSNLSPVNSAAETQGDEEDYMARLTRKMAQSFLLDDEKEPSFLQEDNAKKNQVMAGSPQSTLCLWSNSGSGSPNGTSQVSSPPTSPLEEQKPDPWDLLSEAAGQVMKQRLKDHVYQQNLHGNGGVSAPPRKPSPPAISAPHNPNHGYYPPPALTSQQLQAAHFYQLKQQQLMKQQLSAAWGRQNRGSRGGGRGYGENRCALPLGLSPSAWPPLQKQQPPQPQPHPHPHPHPQPQPQPGSGMRAVFLTGAGTRRESAGTGVFLPRGVGSSNESKKKPSCSTVLLPARVVQALNLNLEELGAQPRYPGGFVLDHDALVGGSNRGGALSLSHQRRNHFRPQPSSSQEIHLPQEWTY